MRAYQLLLTVCASTFLHGACCCLATVALSSLLSFLSACCQFDLGNSSCRWCVAGFRQRRKLRQLAPLAASFAVRPKRSASTRPAAQARFPTQLTTWNVRRHCLHTRPNPPWNWLQWQTVMQSRPSPAQVRHVPCSTSITTMQHGRPCACMRTGSDP